MKKFKSMVSLVCKAVTVAMGVAVVALSIMKMIDVNTAVIMLGIGAFCTGIAFLQNFDSKKD